MGTSFYCKCLQLKSTSNDIPSFMHNIKDVLCGELRNSFVFPKVWRRWGDRGGGGTWQVGEGGRSRARESSPAPGAAEKSEVRGQRTDRGTQRVPDTGVLVRAISVGWVGGWAERPSTAWGSGATAHCDHTLTCCPLVLRGNGTIARRKWGERGVELFFFIILFLFSLRGREAGSNNPTARETWSPEAGRTAGMWLPRESQGLESGPEHTYRLGQAGYSSPCAHWRGDVGVGGNGKSSPGFLLSLWSWEYMGRYQKLGQRENIMKKEASKEKVREIPCDFRGALTTHLSLALTTVDYPMPEIGDTKRRRCSEWG